MIEFLTGALITDPRRVGKPLRGDLARIHSARRGTYRVLYRINDLPPSPEVVVLRIETATTPTDPADRSTAGTKLT